MAYPYQTGYNQVMPPVYGGYGQQPLQPQGPMCRMVSSREEASSTPVEQMAQQLGLPFRR